MGIKEVLSAPRSPWQSAYVETHRKPRPVQPLERGPSLSYRKLAVFTTFTSGAQPERISPRHNSYPGDTFAVSGYPTR